MVDDLGCHSNSAFLDLTEQQRDELGGIEYRSLKTLAVILVSYFFGFSLLGVICLAPWILRNPNFGEIVTADGQGKVWWALFTANSAFTDLGFTLTPDSMISFQLATWPLIVMSFLITIGNTGFPIMLRIIIWIGAQINNIKSASKVPENNEFPEFLLSRSSRAP